MQGIILFSYTQETHFLAEALELLDPCSWMLFPRYPTLPSYFCLWCLSLMKYHFINETYPDHHIKCFSTLTHYTLFFFFLQSYSSKGYTSHMDTTEQLNHHRALPSPVSFNVYFLFIYSCLFPAYWNTSA